MSRSKIAIFCLFGLAYTTAFLYCCLLPLWGGFDEPFHYGYVESLSRDGRLPVLGHAYISAEIEESLKLLAFTSTLTAQMRPGFLAQGWMKLDADRNKLRAEPSRTLNYEAQQAPLAYFLLVPFNQWFSSYPLRARVLAIRLLSSLASVTLTLFAAGFLFRELNLEAPFRLIALFCVASSQMLYATVAHISNDWLAVPLMIAFFGCLVRLINRPGKSRAMILAATLAAGLLTKAYFLAYVPVFAGAVIYCVWRKRLTYRSLVLAFAIPALTAGPWYLRNRLLVGTFSGLQDSGVGMGSILHALWATHWLESLMSLARWSLWTGNWSFVSFSKSTLDFDLLLIAIGFLLYVLRVKQATAAEAWLLAGMLSFALALIYDGAMYAAFTHGAAKHAEPYYTQGMFPCIWGVSLLGAQRGRAAGRIAAILLLLANAWIALNTYVVKLIPFYGGMQGRATAAAVLGWWLHSSKAVLASAVMAPLPVLYGLTLLQTLALLLCLALVLRSTMWRGAEL